MPEKESFGENSKNLREKISQASIIVAPKKPIAQCELCELKLSFLL